MEAFYVVMLVFFLPALAALGVIGAVKAARNVHFSGRFPRGHADRCLVGALGTADPSFPPPYLAG